MIKTFKIVALLEGWSYLIMIFIGLPLRYIGDNDIIIKKIRNASRDSFFNLCCSSCNYNETNEVEY